MCFILNKKKVCCGTYMYEFLNEEQKNVLTMMMMIIIIRNIFLFQPRVSHSLAGGRSMSLLP